MRENVRGLEFFAAEARYTHQPLYFRPAEGCPGACP